MNRRILFALSAITLFAGAGAAHAEDGPVYEVAKCRRWQSSCCYRPSTTYVLPRPNYSSATAINQTVIRDSFNNYSGSLGYSTGSLGYSGLGGFAGGGAVAVAGSGVAKAAAYFGPRTPAPWMPVPPAADVMTPGRTYTVRVNHLKGEGGDVVIYIGGTSHACNVLNWTPSEVVFEVPNMGVTPSGSSGQLVITRFDGVEAENKPVLLVNRPSMIEHEELPPGQPKAQAAMLPFGSALQQVGG